MTKKEYKSPKNWWLCENEYCRHPLGRIVKGDFMNIEILEIEGKNGEKFNIKPKFIDVFCKKCGKRNNVLGGKIASKDWDNNLKSHTEENDDLDEGELDEFLANSYKRNKLLNLLTDKQKRLFNFFMQNKDYKELEFEKIAKELNISREILLKDWSIIDQKVAEIDNEIRIKNSELLTKDLEATAKKLKSGRG